MPDLTLMIGAGRLLLVAYASLATALATACLALHLITHLDKRSARRPARVTPRRASRPLFLRLDPELDAP